MKLQAQSSRVLCSALKKSTKGVGGKSTLAILDHVLLSRREDGKYMFISATNDTQLCVPAPFTDIDGKLGKSVCLPIGVLSQFLATLPDCVVTFNFIGSNSLLLEYCSNSGDEMKRGEAKFSVFIGDEFPSMTGVSTDATHISLPYAVFNEALEKASPFIEVNELRPVLSTFLIDIAEDRSEVSFVGTNGHMLYKTSFSNNPQKGGCDFFCGGEARKIKLHNSYFRTLSAFDGVENIDIESDGRVIRLSSGDIEMLCKEIDSRYPNYNSVIPKGNPFYVTFDKGEMLAVIKRVSLLASGASNLIKIQKNGMFIDVSAEDRDYSQSSHDQVFIADAQCEDGFAIGFNAQTLLNSVNSIQGNTVRMQLSEANRAAVLTADEPSPTSLALCMPMSLES